MGQEGSAMKRLVTQFDDTRTRTTIATPTCGGCCCCCCCCVASTLAVSSVTALNVGGLTAENKIEPNVSVGYTILGFLALPLAIGLGVTTAPYLSVLGILLAIVAWMLLMKLAYTGSGLKNPVKIIGVTTGLGVVLLAAEFGAGLFLILGDGTGSGGIPAYLAVAAILTIVLVPFLRFLTQPLLRTAPPIGSSATHSVGHKTPTVSEDKSPIETVVDPQSNDPSAPDRDDQQQS